MRPASPLYPDLVPWYSSPKPLNPTSPSTTTPQSRNRTQQRYYRDHGRTLAFYFLIVLLLHVRRPQASCLVSALSCPSSHHTTSPHPHPKGDYLAPLSPQTPCSPVSARSRASIAMRLRRAGPERRAPPLVTYLKAIGPDSSLTI
jgi:hypothetical protein